MLEVVLLLDRFLSVGLDVLRFLEGLLSQSLQLFGVPRFDVIDEALLVVDSLPEFGYLLRELKL